MLIVKDGNLVFNEAHLFDDKITSIEGIEARYNNLEVNILLHIVSDPSCRYEKNYGNGRISNKFAKLSAKERFLSILNDKLLVGNPKGYYVNKHRNGAKALVNDQIKSVSFAFSTMDEVARHFRARGSQYGIVFFHDFLNNNGIRPVIYINDHDKEAIRNIVFNSPHLIESYGRGYDMRWEKEWRIHNQLPFQNEDVAFLIVPDDEYDEFIHEINEGNIEDFGLLPASLFDDPIRFFLFAHKLDHHAWYQIRIFGDWKVDFDMFPEPTPGEVKQLQRVCGTWIDCLRKSEIQEFYEHRYIRRFLSFTNKIDPSHLNRTISENLGVVRDNADEPYQTHRDLMMLCYTERFNIQNDRIDLGLP